MNKPHRDNKFSFQALNRSNFNDFESLFIEKDACKGCWCMQCRLDADAFEAGRGKKNLQAMRDLVDSGKIPGIITYHDKEAIGWCSFGKKEDFQLASIDNKSVSNGNVQTWIISCLFIRQEWRTQGVKKALLEYLIDFCASKGGRLIESHQCNSSFSRFPDAFAWTSIEKAYEAVGFVKDPEGSEKRPMMRYYF